MIASSWKGGGSRGYGSLVHADRIQSAPGCAGFFEESEVWIGCSVGAIISGLLASGYTIRECIDFFDKHLAAIFTRDWFRTITGLDGWLRAKYSRARLEGPLREVFGDALLGDLPGRVCLLAVEWDNEHPNPDHRKAKLKVWNNVPGAPSNDCDVPIVTAIGSSASAGFYFPMWDRWGDGGHVGLANPALWGLNHLTEPRYYRVPISDVRMFSMGTNGSNYYMRGRNQDYGRLGWASRVTSPMLQGVDEAITFTCGNLLGDRFFELDPKYPHDMHVTMDQDRRARIREFCATTDIRPACEWVRNQRAER